MLLKSVCVYCGSSDGRLDVYADAARGLGKALVSRGIKLVYGGASVGLMGILADTVLELGGAVVGVIPESLVLHEVAHKSLTDLRVTQTMHERKTLMSELAEGFIAMPGGIGTLEELFEIWTWGQLGFHQKPYGVLNIDGYFDSLLEFIDRAVADEFVKPAHRQMLIASNSPSEILDQFDGYSNNQISKWKTRLPD